MFVMSVHIYTINRGIFLWFNRSLMVLTGVLFCQFILLSFPVTQFHFIRVQLFLCLVFSVLFLTFIYQFCDCEFDRGFWGVLGVSVVGGFLCLGTNMVVSQVLILTDSLVLITGVFMSIILILGFVLPFLLAIGVVWHLSRRTERALVKSKLHIILIAVLIPMAFIWASLGVFLVSGDYFYFQLVPLFLAIKMAGVFWGLKRFSKLSLPMDYSAAYLFNHTQDGVVLINHDGEVIMANPKAHESLALTEMDYGRSIKTFIRDSQYSYQKLYRKTVFKFAQVSGGYKQIQLDQAPVKKGDLELGKILIFCVI